MKETIPNKAERNSSIEMLKLFGIALIVVSHVIQTLGSKGNGYISFYGFGVDLTEATTNVQYLILSMLRYCGEFGNTIFFVCSAWFFLDNDRVDKKKIFMMLMDIWTISVLILVPVLIAEHGQTYRSLVLMALLPTTFENHWYPSCYLILYALHPLLNQIIQKNSRKTLLRLNAAAVVMYFVIAFATCLTRYMFLEGTTFFASRLVIWVVLYFLIGYMKKYADSFMLDKRRYGTLILVGFLGYFGLIWLMNRIGLRSEVFRNSLQIWRECYNPFLILLVLGLFHFARSREYTIGWVNYLSKLSLFIYIIHENRLLRSLYRPAIWNAIYLKFGYDHILGWTFLLSAGVFAFGLVFSILYYEVIRKATTGFYTGIYNRLSGTWARIENRLLRIGSD